MGVHTRMYKLDEKLAINIPSLVLPPSRLQTIEETITVPGYEAETITWFPLLTGKIAPDGRMPMAIRRETLEWLGLDPTKDVFIKLKWDIWRRAHVWHQHKRLWIPRAVVKSLEKRGLRPDSYYDVHIRGTTPPTTKTRTVTREVIPKVIVRHLGVNHATDNYAPNRWRWVIPDKIADMVFRRTLDMGFVAEAECYYAPGPGVIEVDLIVPSEGKTISSYTGFAFRNVANRNYSLKRVDDYPFFCEIRASFISAYPREWWQTSIGGTTYHNILIAMLNNTVTNMFNWHPLLSSLWFGRDKLTYETTRFKPTFQTALYTSNTMRHGNATPPKEVETEGEEINERVSYADVIEFPFERCIKYIRIINKQMGYYVYDNGRIEAEMAESEKIWVDDKGFIWR